MFCKNCGRELVGAPSYCPHCGAKVQENVVETGGGKSKTASILLAVFLAFWTWLYTYRRDAWKFWVGLGLAIFSIILAIATAGFSLVFSWVFGLGVWVWAIMDTATKKDEWYRSYS